MMFVSSSYHRDKHTQHKYIMRLHLNYNYVLHVLCVDRVCVVGASGR